MKAKKDAPAAAPLKGVMNRNEVAQRLRERGSRFAFPDRIKKYLHLLRRDLDRFLNEKLGAAPHPDGWGEMLLPFEEVGWLVTVPAENLQVTDLDADFNATTSASSATLVRGIAPAWHSQHTTGSW
jgi:hypothetical protein